MRGFWLLGQEALVQSRTTGESVLTRMENLLITVEPVLDWHCLQSGWPVLELREIFWTVAVGSGQLPALLHRLCPEGRS